MKNMNLCYLTAMRSIADLITHRATWFWYRRLANPLENSALNNMGHDYGWTNALRQIVERPSGKRAG
jgi:hypothetical protein